MNYLRSIDFDFRDILEIDKGLYKKPLIPAVLWKALEQSSIALWPSILKPYRVYFTLTQVDDLAHTCMGEYDEDTHTSNVVALVSKNDTHHNLIFQVIQTVMHEYIHASQSYCNSEQFNNVGDSKTFEDYLSEWREIQALAHCAFLEIMEYTDRPTRTMDLYSEVPEKIRKAFYRNISRWSQRYQVILQLNK